MKSSVFFKAAPLAMASGVMLLGVSTPASAQLAGGNINIVTNPDVATTPYETPITVDIMGNDEGSISDIIANNPDLKVDMNLAVPNDGNPITGKKITTADGTYVLNDDHTVTYTPAAGITGERAPVYYYYTITSMDPVTGEEIDTYNTQVAPVTITVGEPAPTTTAPTTAEPSTTAPTTEPSATTSAETTTPTESSTTPAPTTSTTDEPTVTPTTDEPSTTSPVPSTSEPTTPTESTTSTSAAPTDSSTTPAPTSSTSEPTASSTDTPTPSSSSSSSTSEGPTASGTATETPSASSTESSTASPTASSSSSSDDDSVISKPSNTDTEIKEKIEGPIIQTDNVSSDSLAPLGLGLGSVGVLGGAAAVTLRRRR